MDRLTLLLVCQDLRCQSSLGGIFRSRAADCGKRFHYPTRTRLPAACPFFNDAEILFNVFTCYVRVAQTLARKRKQLVEDERGCVMAVAVNPLELRVQPMPGSAEKV